MSTLPEYTLEVHWDGGMNTLSDILREGIKTASNGKHLSGITTRVMGAEYGCPLGHFMCHYRIVKVIPIIVESCDA